MSNVLDQLLHLARGVCLAGGAHNQVCRLEPELYGAASGVRHRVIKPGS